MHHLAITLDAAEALDALYGRLQDNGEIEIELEPAPLNNGPGRHMMCTVPGGTQIEFIAMQPSTAAQIA